MKRSIVGAFLVLPFLPPALRAGDLSLYYLNNLAVQYEGTGYRPVPSGWELKVKPQGSGQGLRWRGNRWQVQYWRNNPYFSWEDGNSADAVNRQTGQTLLGFDTLIADVRLRLAGTPVEAVAGLQAARALFERKDIVFHGVREAESATERLSGLGPVLGFHGSAEKPLGSWALWADGEVLTGHFFWTRNKLTASGGGIHRDGFTYLFRAEAGLRRGDFRFGLGLIRQAAEFLVPGGKGLPAGAAASLPINKIDFESPFISVSWAGL